MAAPSGTAPRCRAVSCGGDGYPITVDASGSTRGLSLAIRSLAIGGVCTTVAFYVRNGTPVPLWRMYLSGSSLVTGLVDARADLPGVLALVASGKLDPGLVTTLVAPWDDAPRALLEPTTKVVLWREPVEVAGQGPRAAPVGQGPASPAGIGEQGPMPR